MPNFSYKVFNYLSFILISAFSGCGLTLANSSNIPELINANWTGTDSNQFQVTKLQNAFDFEGLPQNFLVFKTNLTKSDLYLFSSPTQKTGGYQYQLIEGKGFYKVCLKRPDAMAIVSMALTNPIALLQVSKGSYVELKVGFCD